MVAARMGFRQKNDFSVANSCSLSNIMAGSMLLLIGYSQEEGKESESVLPTAIYSIHKAILHTHYRHFKIS